MTAREYAQKALNEFSGPLVMDDDGIIEEMQCVVMVLCGIVLALTSDDD